MEKLLDLSADERFDLVVLDTPPTRHALDFLEAPERLMGFLDTSVLRWFLKPYFVAGRLTLKVATRTGRLRPEARRPRARACSSCRTCPSSSSPSRACTRASRSAPAQVHELLRRDDAGFVLVAGPAALTLDEALYFHRRLVEREMPFVGFIVNRVHPVRPRRPRPRGAAARHRRRPRRTGWSRSSRTTAGWPRRRRRNVARLEDETGDGADPACRSSKATCTTCDGLHEVGDAAARARRRRRRGAGARGRGRAAAAGAGRAR